MKRLPAQVLTGLNRIHHCDAATLVNALPSHSIDLVLTDPPYGLYGRTFEFPHKKYTAINELWDKVVPLAWMRQVERLLKPGGSVVCFGVRQSIYQVANEALRLDWRIVNDVTWYKPDAPPNFTGRMMAESTERAIWFCPDGRGWTYNLDYAKQVNGGKNLRDVWEHGSHRGGRLHPSQKPTTLIEKFIRLLSQPDDVVLDPFSGSGTTAIAALKAGRHYICGDSHYEYVALAQRRVLNEDPYQETHLENGRIQPSLFSSAGRVS